MFHSTSIKAKWQIYDILSLHGIGAEKLRYHSNCQLLLSVPNKIKREQTKTEKKLNFLDHSNFNISEYLNQG